MRTTYHTIQKKYLCCNLIMQVEREGGGREGRRRKGRGKKREKKEKEEGGGWEGGGEGCGVGWGYAR